MPSADTVALILASGSPRRRSLLAGAGVRLEIRPAVGVDETWSAPEHPVTYTRRLARAKAMEVAQGAVHGVPAPAWVLAADTTVWCDPYEGPLGKPEDRASAAQLARRLVRAGRHLVTTAYALIPSQDPPAAVVRHFSTEVWFREIGDAELERYLDGEDWRDKAGGYGIQSDAAGWVREVRGSYTNVVGLPLAEVLEDLRHHAPEVFE